MNLYEIFLVNLSEVIKILRTTSQSRSRSTAPLVGEPLAGRASPTVRLGLMERKAVGPALIGSGIVLQL